jgi:hypothetical protein
MELVGGGNDDRFDLRIRQHRVILEIGDPGLVNGGHAAHQVFGHITDGVQVGIACLAAGLKMCRLRDRACPHYAYSQQSCFFLSHACSKSGKGACSLTRPGTIN